MRKARAHAALLVALGLAGSIAQAFAACDGALAEMLHPVLHPGQEARAYWLDAASLQGRELQFPPRGVAIATLE